MTRVETEPDVELAQRLPQSFERLDVTAHRVVAARGVLDEHWDRPFDLLEDLGPAVEPALHVVLGVARMDDHSGRADLRSALERALQDLAGRDAHPIVRRRDVDEVGSVHVDRHVAGAELLCVGPGWRLLPRLRLPDEHLQAFGLYGCRLLQGAF
jgi:hypothetical protein